MFAWAFVEKVSGLRIMICCCLVSLMSFLLMAV